MQDICMATDYGISDVRRLEGRGALCLTKGSHKTSCWGPPASIRRVDQNFGVAVVQRVHVPFCGRRRLLLGWVQAGKGGPGYMSWTGVGCCTCATAVVESCSLGLVLV